MHSKNKLFEFLEENILLESNKSLKKISLELYVKRFKNPLK